MKISASRGEALLVDGPATLTVSRGVVTVFGAEYGPGSKLAVPRGERLPVLVMDEATILKGRAGSTSVMCGNPIPPSWSSVVQKVRDMALGTALVVGGADSGKSSLCLYLANMLSKDGMRVGVMDCDLGQSDIGPPGTLGLAIMDRPRPGFWEVDPAIMVFVGAKTPAMAMSATEAGLERMRRLAASLDPGLLIINSDGWISGYGAIRIKQKIVDIYSPDLTIAIRKDGELDPMIERLEGTKVRTVQAPEGVMARSRKARRKFREGAYSRYLRNAKVRSFLLSVVQDHDGDITSALVGLEDDKGRLLGIGVLYREKRKKGIVEVLTPVHGDVRSIRVGSIRLSKRGKELE